MALAADLVPQRHFADIAADLQVMQRASLEATNEVILDHLDSSVTLIPEVARHLIAAGGKRLRPLVTLAAAELCGATDERPRLLAGAVELIHAATLLHDDVVDDSALRRGLETANVVFGNKESVLVGDFLFARAFELMVKTGSLGVLEILSRASCTIAEGEVLQLTTQADTETTKRRYLDVIEAKTAALFAAAAEAGAVVAGAPLPQADALRRFGLHFGIAYQLVDDALDYAGDAHGLGKTAGDDFREGKMTLPVIFALESTCSEDEKAFWDRTLRLQQQTPEDFSRAQRLIERDDVLERCLSEASAHADKAAQALGALPDVPVRRILEELALSSVARLS